MLKDELEPYVRGLKEFGAVDIATMSSALSLKRIADTLEQLAKDHKPKPVGSWRKVKDTTGREPEWTDTGLRSTGDWIP